MAETSVSHAHETHEPGSDDQLWEGGKERHEGQLWQADDVVFSRV
jgi:hypothetical protein